MARSLRNSPCGPPRLPRRSAPDRFRRAPPAGRRRTHKLRRPDKPSEASRPEWVNVAVGGAVYPLPPVVMVIEPALESIALAVGQVTPCGECTGLSTNLPPPSPPPS